MADMFHQSHTEDTCDVAHRERFPFLYLERRGVSAIRGSHFSSSQENVHSRFWREDWIETLDSDGPDLHTRASIFVLLLWWRRQRGLPELTVQPQLFFK